MLQRISLAALTLFVVFMVVALTAATLNNHGNRGDFCTGFIMVAGWVLTIMLIGLNFRKDD